MSTGTSIASNVPAIGEGISVSTLSVETSSRASSSATESPTFLSQRVTVPSLTLSPSAGIEITVPPLDAGALAGAGAAATGAAGAAGGGGGGVGAAGAAGAAVCSLAAPVAITASSAPTATV